MLIDVKNLSFGYEDNLILTDVEFSVSEGDKIGLVGLNGAGKTTLIRLINGEYSADNGEIFIKNGLRIGYLEQNGGYNSDNTVYAEMLSLFKSVFSAIDNLRDIERQMSVTDHASREYKELSNKYERLNKLISAQDGYNVEVRIKRVLNGMGFASAYDKVISVMSGGEKTRLKLCKLLLEEPELLILDEPTNHLDLNTLFWLEGELATYKGAMLLVSHDRYFLDRLTERIFDLENKKITVYKGNYTKYKQLKAERQTVIAREYEKQQQEIASLTDYIARNLVRASTTKMAQSRRKKLEKTEIIEKPTSGEQPPQFEFVYEQAPYENVLTINNLRLCAGEKTLADSINLQIKRGDRIALCGDNGAGKTTLIRKIVASQTGRSNEVSFGRFVKLAYYEQENESLNSDNTVLDEFWFRFSYMSQTEARSRLAKMRLDGEDVFKRVGDLSGGERARLALAVFQAQKGNFLILDEPTNHLDLAARESLEDALRAFDGTLVFVSHDRYFIERLASKIALMANNALTVFDGGYQEYVNAKSALKSIACDKTDNKQNSYYRSKNERAELVKQKQRLAAVEKQIAELERRESELQAQMCEVEVASDYKRFNKAQSEYEAAVGELKGLYEEYFSLAESVEGE